jgi:hypothetical protein
VSPRLRALGCALATSAVALAIASSAAAADSLVTYACSPPLPKAAANCALWHTTPVTLTWGFPASYDPLPPGDCTTRKFNTDTARTDVQCIVHIPPAGDIQFATATVRVDVTPPAVTGMTAARPADHDGWWNHPVALTFAGTDGTSGIAACDVVDYSGPDSGAAAVTGSCSDVAGNTAAGTFPFAYDATPPTVTPGSSDAKVGHISLTWTPSADAVSSRVLRSPGIGSAAVSDVYSGPNRSFTDPAVTGGRTYTYTINAADVAGNVASTTMTALAKAPAPPRLDWRTVKPADYYNVQLFRNGRKILSAWPRHSRLQLRKQWRYAGRQRKLSPGTYHWYVWPGFGRRSAHRYGKLIMQRRFTIGGPTTKTKPGKAASRG